MNDTKSENKNLPVPTSELLSYAPAILSPDEVSIVKEYLEKGGLQLSPNTASRFFQLFLNGDDCKEIHRLNSNFPYESILIARVKYRWDEKREEYIYNLTDAVRSKVLKAQLETTDLMTSLLNAANKKHGDKIKKYLQSGDEEDLKGAFNIETIHSLMKITESLMKVTGQDRQFKVTNENKNTLDVNLNQKGSVSSQSSNVELTPEEAANILKVIADAKRRKANETKN